MFASATMPGTSFFLPSKGYFLHNLTYLYTYNNFTALCVCRGVWLFYIGVMPLHIIIIFHILWSIFGPFVHTWLIHTYQHSLSSCTFLATSLININIALNALYIFIWNANIINWCLCIILLHRNAFQGHYRKFGLCIFIPSRKSWILNPSIADLGLGIFII